MSRLGHYLKPGVRASAPSVLFSVIVTPRVEPGAHSETDTFHTFGGSAAVVSRWRRGRWHRGAAGTFERPADLLAWMDAHADPERRNHVVTPDAAETLAMGGVWADVDSGRVVWRPHGTRTPARAARGKRAPDTEIRRIAVGARCTVLDMRHRGRTWVWASGTQYLTAGEPEIAAALGYSWPQTGRYDTPDGTCSRTAAERAELWLLAFQELATWWRSCARAPWGLTAAGMSMGILRTHIQPKELCSHSHEWAHRLERAAAVGGRAQTFYFGDVGIPAWYATDRDPAPGPSPHGQIPGPVAHYDVRSMYPSLLRDMSFPVALTSYREDRGPKEPQAYAESFGVIARVTIDTDSPNYPVRTGDHIAYPVGRFTTVLTGPELLRLKGEGKVVACHAMAIYRMGRPFRAAAQALIELRERARAEGRPAWELFAKLMANGLGGKLAQAKGVWEQRPKLPALMRFGEWYQERKSTGKVARFRGIAGCVWEYVPDATGRGPYTFAFAYLTAYGRLHLRGLIDACPSQTVVSVDTDGLWVLPDGDVALRAHARCGADVAGGLRRVGESPCGRWFGPRHYFTTGGWVLAGFSAPTVCDDGRWVRDSQRRTPLAGPAGAPPAGVCVTARTSRLDVGTPGVAVGADGWARPRRRAT